MSAAKNRAYLRVIDEIDTTYHMQCEICAYLAAGWASKLEQSGTGVGEFPRVHANAKDLISDNFLVCQRDRSVLFFCLYVCVCICACTTYVNVPKLGQASQNKHIFIAANPSLRSASFML